MNLANRPWRWQPARTTALVATIALLLGVLLTLLLKERHDRSVNDAEETSRRSAQSFAQAVALQIEGRIHLTQSIAQSPSVLSGDPAAVQAFLGPLELASLNVDALLWVDASGGVAAASGLPNSSASYRSAAPELVAAANRSGGAVIGVSAVGDVQPGPLIIVAYPTYNAAGDFTGVIETENRTVRPDAVVNAPLDAWHSAVVTANGEIVSRDGAVQSLQPVAAERTLQAAQASPAGVLPDALAIDGTPHSVVGFAQVPQSHWMVFLERARSDAFGDASTQYGFGLPTLWAVAAVVVGGVGAAAWRRDLAMERREAAHQAVTYAERLLRSFADQMPVLAWRTPEGGTGGFANRAYRDYFGTDRVGDLCDLPCVPGDRNRLESLVSQVTAGVDAESEVRLVGHDGLSRWHVVRAQHVTAPEPGIVCAAADIQELREALEARDDFLALVSHELRTPLTMILGDADVLWRRGDALELEARRELQDDIRRESERLRGLIENMLFLSQLQSGVVQPPEPQLLQRLIPSVTADFAKKTPEMTIALSIDESMPPVNVHVVTVQQVLQNLLSNARKYAGTDVEVAVGSRDGWVAVAVLDRGPGVPEADVERLFTPYFRSGETSERTVGLGLGLAVCQRLMEASGGKIYAERREAGGMEFGFCLPPLHDDDGDG